MIMKKLVLLLSFTTALFAQDISGTYTGTLKPEGGEGNGGSGTIVLKQDGQTLIVTGGAEPGQADAGYQSGSRRRIAEV